MSTRRLTAILAADIAGYSALMAANEIDTVSALKGHQTVILPMVAAYSGRVIDTAGDGILAEFPSVLNAVKCAVAIQEVMLERNASVPPDRRMQFRIGINQGDVLVDEERIFGDGINIAARLEQICQPGGICISGKVYDEINGRFEIQYKDVGEKVLKNIPNPVRVYAVSIRSPGVTAVERRDDAPSNPALKKYIPLGLVGCVILATVVGASLIIPSFRRALVSLYSSVTSDREASVQSDAILHADRRALSEQLIARYALVVPGLSQESRERNAREYADDKFHKAQAASISPPGLWRATARENPELAKEAALENCQVFFGVPCVLIATDSSLPPIRDNGDWARSDMPRVRYSGPVHPDQIPGGRNFGKRADIAGYLSAKSYKAMALHPTARLFVITGAASPYEAEDRSLNLCNNDPQRNGANGQCFLYASGDQVVLPQRLRKPLSKRDPVQR